MVVQNNIAFPFKGGNKITEGKDCFGGIIEIILWSTPFKINYRFNYLIKNI